MLLFLVLVLATIISFIYLFLNHKTKNEKPLNLPPGPKGLPIIGNLLQLDYAAPHVYFANLKKSYGPILSLRLGKASVVVVQSAKIAKEVMQTQDLNFCSRPPLVGIHRLSYYGLDIAFAPYGDYFKEVKKISVVHLFNSKRVKSFAPIRHEEVDRLVKKVSDLSSTSQVVNLSELLMNYACSNMCRIAFGKRYEDEQGSRSKFHSLLNEAQALFIAFFFADYFPSFGWLDKLTGQSARLERAFHELDAFYEEIISDHLDPNKHKFDHKTIIDVLLHLKKERSFAFELTFDHIKAILMIIFVAGSDTSTATVVWAMTQLIKNPNALKRVQEELRNSIASNGNIVEDELSKLEYFKAVVKETFRLQPAVPLLVVRETINKTKVEGYDILPKTLVHINAWAIGRDHESWEHPEKFMPERFMGNKIDYKGQDFELIPFGAGRRICPGLNLGVVNLELALANLLYHFEWKLPDGVTPEDIDTNVNPGITMHKKNPLHLMAKKYV